MSQIQWCDECHRIVDIGCTCGMSFKDKIKGVSFSSEGLPNSKAFQRPSNYPAGGKLSNHRPHGA